MRGLRVTPGIYREICSESLSDESFEQGTTYSLLVSRSSIRAALAVTSSFFLGIEQAASEAGRWRGRG